MLNCWNRVKWFKHTLLYHIMEIPSDYSKRIHVIACVIMYVYIYMHMYIYRCVIMNFKFISCMLPSLLWQTLLSVYLWYLIMILMYQKLSIFIISSVEDSYSEPGL